MLDLTMKFLRNASKHLIQFGLNVSSMIFVVSRILLGKLKALFNYPITWGVLYLLLVPGFGEYYYSIKNEFLHQTTLYDGTRDIAYLNVFKKLNDSLEIDQTSFGEALWISIKGDHAQEKGLLFDVELANIPNFAEEITGHSNFYSELDMQISSSLGDEAFEMVDFVDVFTNLFGGKDFSCEFSFDLNYRPDQSSVKILDAFWGGNGLYPYHRLGDFPASISFKRAFGDESLRRGIDSEDIEDRGIFQRAVCASAWNSAFNRLSLQTTHLDSYLLIDGPNADHTELSEYVYDYHRATNGGISSGPNSRLTLYYFSAVTVTTLGYGDIVPVTDDARFWVMIQSMLGLVLIGCFLNSVFRGG